MSLDDFAQHASCVLSGRIAALEAENERLEQRIKTLRDRITWHRDGFREMSTWSPEVAAVRTRQFARDALTGPTSEALAQIRAGKEAALAADRVMP